MVSYEQKLKEWRDNEKVRILNKKGDRKKKKREAGGKSKKSLLYVDPFKINVICC